MDRSALLAGWSGASSQDPAAAVACSLFSWALPVCLQPLAFGRPSAHTPGSEHCWLDTDGSQPSPVSPGVLTVTHSGVLVSHALPCSRSHPRPQGGSGRPATPPLLGRVLARQPTGRAAVNLGQVTSPWGARPARRGWEACGARPEDVSWTSGKRAGPVPQRGSGHRVALGASYFRGQWLDFHQGLLGEELD